MNNINNIIDISWPVSTTMTTYKDRHDVYITNDKTWEESKSRETRININVHTGTHIDAPAHFLQMGAPVNTIVLEKLYGQCLVLDLTCATEQITVQDLEYALEKQNTHNKLITKILLKTRNSFLENTREFNKNFVYLEKSGAEYLAHKNIHCIGIDYLGIERNQPEHETHNILLEKNIIIIEGLRLKHVEPGTYTLMCLPILLEGAEAAPARAVLIME